MMQAPFFAISALAFLLSVPFPFQFQFQFQFPLRLLLRNIPVCVRDSICLIRVTEHDLIVFLSTVYKFTEGAELPSVRV